ncbi:hypothetical protein CHS0354_019490 [Potamilus streckersoni]|uniref:Uncharacterized protein n=1 Tax=Potamilus streckersoni TaxID=2493646 RepID=A0AAE0VWG2_9BIVA|nr:hypothetical protein CHS0354_019490 [Potamilus streckersoni]
MKRSTQNSSLTLFIGKKTKDSEQNFKTPLNIIHVLWIKNDPKTIHPYPGEKARSRFWTYFGFYKALEGPPTKENSDTMKVLCKLQKGVCKQRYEIPSRKSMSYKIVEKKDQAKKKVKEELRVESRTSDEQPSDILPPLPVTLVLSNVGDDNDKTVLTLSPSNKKAKVNVHMDDWLQDVVCLGDSQQPITDFIHQEVSKYLVAAHLIPVSQCYSGGNKTVSSTHVLAYWLRSTKVFRHYMYPVRGYLVWLDISSARKRFIYAMIMWT